MSFPRYPSYKESFNPWIGSVPEHWEKSTAFKVVQEKYVPNTGLAVSNLLSLSFGKIICKDINTNDGLLPESFETYQVVEPNDIVFRPTDLQNDWNSLRSAIVREQGIITSAYIAVSPTNASPDFLNYLFRAYDHSKVFYSMGGGLRQAFKFSDIRRLPIYTPPIDEQHAIASFLDGETAKIDALVAEQRRLVELLKEKRQAVISHAVTKGLDPTVPMKPSGIPWLGDVPEHWDVQRVKTVTSFVTSGPRGWSERITETGALFIQSGDLDDKLNINFEGCKRVYVENDAEAARTQLLEGDVVICVTGAKTGNVAVCKFCPETAYVNQHVCLIRPTSQINSSFLGIQLKSDLGQTYFAVSQYGLKQGLSLESVKEAPVVLPPLREQAMVVDFISGENDKFNSLITEAERAICLLQERRTALISAAVTGKIDVRDFASIGVQT
jgi:type I restriction enzyme S subunit